MIRVKILIFEHPDSTTDHRYGRLLLTEILLNHRKSKTSPVFVCSDDDIYTDQLILKHERFHVHRRIYFFTEIAEMIMLHSRLYIIIA